MPTTDDDDDARRRALHEARSFTELRHRLLLVVALLALPFYMSYAAEAAYAGGLRFIVASLLGSAYLGLGIVRLAELWSWRCAGRTGSKGR